MPIDSLSTSFIASSSARLEPWRSSPVDSSQCRKPRSSCLNHVSCQGHRNNIGVHTDTEGIEDLAPYVIFLEFEDWWNETERARRILPDTTGPREGRRSFASSSGGPGHSLSDKIDKSLECLTNLGK